MGGLDNCVIVRPTKSDDWKTCVRLCDDAHVDIATHTRNLSVVGVAEKTWLELTDFIRREARMHFHLRTEVNSEAALFDRLQTVAKWEDVILSAAIETKRSTRVIHVPKEKKFVILPNILATVPAEIRKLTQSQDTVHFELAEALVTRLSKTPVIIDVEWLKWTTHGTVCLLGGSSSDTVLRSTVEGAKKQLTWFIDEKKQLLRIANVPFSTVEAMLERVVIDTVVRDGVNVDFLVNDARGCTNAKSFADAIGHVIPDIADLPDDDDEAAHLVVEKYGVSICVITIVAGVGKSVSVYRTDHKDQPDTIVIMCEVGEHVTYRTFETAQSPRTITEKLGGRPTPSRELPSNGRD